MDLGPLIEYAETAGFELSTFQLEQFDKFGEALYDANKRMNLTRVAYAECATRHFVDSLLIQEFVPLGSTVLDVGCGPGFPSWPLACARPDLRVTAMDSSRKMLGFLETQPLQNLRIVNSRAEIRDISETFDIVTGRAVAPLAVQLEASTRWVKQKGRLIPFRTSAEVEMMQPSNLKALGLVLLEIKKVELPRTESLRVFPVYEKIQQPEKSLPRRWAEIKSRPLF